MIPIQPRYSRTSPVSGSDDLDIGVPLDNDTGHDHLVFNIADLDAWLRKRSTCQGSRSALMQRCGYSFPSSDCFTEANTSMKLCVPMLDDDDDVPGQALQVASA